MLAYTTVKKSVCCLPHKLQYDTGMHSSLNLIMLGFEFHADLSTHTLPVNTVCVNDLPPIGCHTSHITHTNCL